MTAARDQPRPPRDQRKLTPLLFGVAVALLALVTAWWFVFLARAVSVENDLRQEALSLRAEILDERTARSGMARVPGPVMEDQRFEIACEPGPGAPCTVRPTRAALAEQDARFRRRKVMIYGEGTLLLLLVLCCVGMLYRLVLAERAYRRDVEAFMDRVTHEMKTPLAGIKALLQTLRDGRVPQERLREVAELGLRQAEREEHLIENLLLAHRLASPASRPETADVDVASCLSDFTAHRERSLPGSGERHVVTCPAALRVRASAPDLVTILENLADNAFKYGATRLALTATEEGSGVQIHARDDGQGFDPQRAEELFRPYQRGSAPGGRHGTGLGLPIARALARAMGGELSASSEGPGLGALFTLTLPRAAGDGVLPARGTAAAPQEARERGSA